MLLLIVCCDNHYDRINLLCANVCVCGIGMAQPGSAYIHTQMHMFISNKHKHTAGVVVYLCVEAFESHKMFIYKAKLIIFRVCEGSV